MNEGLVSIIIPVYNRADHLGKCLDSIQEQTWTNLEVIVVDDGSTDRSRAIVREFVERDARFHLFTVEHQGPSAARNKGIEEATGEFLTFVDADDYIEPDYIRNLITAIGDADICISGYKAWYQDRGLWQTVKPPAGRFTLAEFKEGISRYERVMGGVAWKLVRRSVVAEHGLRFPPEVRYAEDLLFFLRYLAQIDAVTVIGDAQYVYRQHGQQSLVKASYRDTARIEQFFAELEKQYEKARRDSLRELIAYWQVLNLWEYGRVICYRTKGVRKRKEQFYAIARQFNIRQKCRRIRHGSLTATAARLTVLTNTFLPFNLFVRAAGKIKRWEKQFA